MKLKSRMLASTFFSLIVTVSCIELSVAADATWPQWRGPHRDGTVEADAWPATLNNAVLKTQWKVDLAESYSGPIVTKDRIFVTETRDRKFEVVRALSRQTGEQLWETKWEGAMKVPFFAASNGSWIRSTPAFDGKCLYVAGMRDVLVCLNAENGEELWRLDFVKKFKSALPSFGFVCSPLVHGEAIYVQAGGSFVKLNKKNGEVIWRSLNDKGGMFGSAFSSPVIAKVAGREQLLVQTRTKLAGVNPDDGKVLWSQEIPAFRGMNIVPPTVVGDNRVFTSSYGGGSFLFQITQDGERYNMEQLWRNKVQGYMSSPVVVGDAIYLHLRNQRFACIDIETGKDQWISKPYGKYWSCVVNNGQLLALDQRGDLHLIRPQTDEFELVGTAKVSDRETWAHLAVVGKEIFVRDLKGLTVYKWNTSN